MTFKGPNKPFHSPRIIELTYTWPAETFIQRHVRALRDAGVNVLLVARASADEQNAGASLGRRDPSLPVTIMPNFDHMGRRGKLWSLRHLLTHPRYALAPLPVRDRVLLAFFEELRPDIIHFHFASLAAIMRWIPQELGIPYTVSMRGSDVQVLPLRSPEQSSMIAQTLRSAAGIHTVCGALGALTQRICEVPLARQTIYTAVPVPPALPAYAPPQNELHFISVGRFHWRKSFPDLLQALKSLLDKGYPAHLTLIGQGEDEARVSWWAQKLGAEKWIDCPGKLPPEQFQNLFSRATAFIQSSMAEGFSNAVAEAMAWGCPVFATDVGGTSEIIRDGENGFLLPALRPEEWPERLELARDRALLKRFREAAYETARAYFSLERHAKEFITFYQDALRRGAPRNDIVTSPPSQNRGDEPWDGGRLHLLVRGEWRWENGTDLVLRALAPLCQEGRLKVTFWGRGPQEDELRYLADFLGLRGHVRLIPTGQRQMEEQEYMAQIVLNIDNAQQHGWQLMQYGKLQKTIMFADYKRGSQDLLYTLNQFLE